jgi:hypothetical protein
MQRPKREIASAPPSKWSVDFFTIGQFRIELLTFSILKNKQRVAFFA